MSQMLAVFASIFISIFLAELGDKTQLATVLFSAERDASPWLVFAAAAAALVTSTAVAVAFGAMAGRLADALPLKLVAGIGFVLIGAWTIMAHFKEA